MKNVGFALGMLYFWVAVIMFGSLVAETVLLYPNILHDVPDSLERGSAFMTETNPGDYFPPLGTATLLLGLLALGFNWRQRSVRYRFGIGVLVLGIGDFLVSMLYMWDRNTIMFTEGRAVHSVAYLRQVAAEFEAVHWARIGAAGAAAVLVFAGVLHTTGNAWRANRPPRAGCRNPPSGTSPAR